MQRSVMYILITMHWSLYIRLVVSGSVKITPKIILHVYQVCCYSSVYFCEMSAIWIWDRFKVK